jgi:hypothetical protein
LGAALAALVLAVLTFGPSLDGLLCHDENGPSAAAQSGVETAPAQDSDGHADEAGPCVHGHCHHGATFLAAAPLDAVAASAPSGRQVWEQARVSTSDPKFGLIRPPRA